jgi:probable selenium-dependent hydroxylase accessory protein YqeC
MDKKYATTSLKDALRLKTGGVISLVGAGGKTSLMFSIAEELSRGGDTVLTTTTTKIMRPSRTLSPLCLVSTNTDAVVYQIRNLFSIHRHVTAAASQIPASGGKLEGFEPETVDRIMESGSCKWIVVEADGAAGRPLKTPALHEPVICESTGWMIAIINLAAVGQPLTDRRVFRPHLYSRLTGLNAGETISEVSLVSAVLAPHGIMKGGSTKMKKVLFLNLAGDPRKLTAGRVIAEMLSHKCGDKPPLDRIVIGHARCSQASYECYDITS